MRQITPPLASYGPPKFREPRTLTFEQMSDPDYALKELKRLNGGKLAITCSKCHHCR